MLFCNVSSSLLTFKLKMTDFSNDSHNIVFLNMDNDNMHFIQYRLVNFLDVRVSSVVVGGEYILYSTILK